MSQHARQMIVHFLSMNMSRSAAEDASEKKGDNDMKMEAEPVLKLSVQEVHAVIANM